MTAQLLIATRNRHKLDEIQAIFALTDSQICSALDFPDIPEVEEDGLTLEANALKKAVTLARTTGLIALADDTGLEVDALNGAPGVYSARYAGPDCDATANNRKLLEALQGQSRRTAQFRCVIALAEPDGTAQCVEGVCRGAIANATRGAAGFGYDPLFIPEGETRTFAEMDADEKNKRSHRGRALQAAHAKWTHLPGIRS